MVKLLTVVVTYNAKQWIDRCFDSILNSTVKSDVFVVDNGSCDGTREYIKSKYGQFVFIESKCNLGFGKANNLGLEYALANDYDYVYLLNQDAWVFENTFENLINIHEANPVFGIISPVQCNSDLSLFDDSFYKCSLDNNIVYKQIFDCSLSEVIETEFVMAAHWLISRECLSKVGGFSPSFPHYGEDNNYIDRVKFHGYKIGICFRERVVHDRAFRPLPISKELYLQYIHCIDDMSNPNKSMPAISRIVCDLLKSALKYKTLQPVVYIGNILRNKSSIIKNRCVSMKGFAFLKVNGGV